MLILGLAIFVSVLMPLYAVYVAWSARSGGRLGYGLKALAALGFMGFLTLIARWDVLTVYLLYFWWALIGVLLLAGLLAMRDRRWIEGEKRGTLLAAAVEPAIGLGLFGYVALGLFPGSDPVDLQWPLGEGRYIVGQGGNSAMLNYHNAHAQQRYALDIVALDAFGRRADGVSPEAMAAYIVYGMPVLAPCAGEVVAAVDGMPDTPIGGSNGEAPAGNHVILRCAGLDITLAHLRAGSVAVSARQTVSAGQRLGEVGSSGNSTEPHLHIHAVPEGSGEDGEGVPLSFGGRFPVRGSIIDG